VDIISWQNVVYAAAAAAAAHRITSHQPQAPRGTQTPAGCEVNEVTAAAAFSVLLADESPMVEVMCHTSAVLLHAPLLGFVAVCTVTVSHNQAVKYSTSTASPLPVAYNRHRLLITAIYECPCMQSSCCGLHVSQNTKLYLSALHGSEQHQWTRFCSHAAAALHAAASCLSRVGFPAAGCSCWSAASYASCWHSAGYCCVGAVTIVAQLLGCTWAWAAFVAADGCCVVLMKTLLHLCVLLAPGRCW
jgi:hypothetical protein